MKTMVEKCENQSPGPQHVAQLLGDWWTRPDAPRIALWCNSDYQEHVISLWCDLEGEAVASSVKGLLSAATSQQSELVTEYERLFVGPAAIPCPPYEAVWRKDRPKHEQGTIMGRSTGEVERIYRDLGLQLRSDQRELADHVAIEFEALAYAWASHADTMRRLLVDHLRTWLPAFCASVAVNSRLEFYRALADVTGQCFATGRSLTAASDLNLADVERTNQCSEKSVYQNS